MSTNVTGTVTAPPTTPPNVGMPDPLVCWCGTSGCPTPEQCRRDYYSSETTWREIAQRPAARKTAA